MIGFSIMMWFASFIVLIVAISLLRGNISIIHGKVFDAAEDKIGYGKQLGKPCLFISIGLCTCGVIASLVGTESVIFYALTVILVTGVISAIWFATIQKKYKSQAKPRL